MLMHTKYLYNEWKPCVGGGKYFLYGKKKRRMDNRMREKKEGRIEKEQHSEA